MGAGAAVEAARATEDPGVPRLYPARAAPVGETVRPEAVVHGAEGGRGRAGAAREGAR